MATVRTITIVAEIEGESLPDWVWESHKEREELNGLTVIAISDGNAIEEFEAAKENFAEDLEDIENDF